MPACKFGCAGQTGGMGFLRVLIVLVGLPLAASLACAGEVLIDPLLRDKARAARQPALIVLPAATQLRAKRAMAFPERVADMVSRLQSEAERSQAPVLDLLRQRGVPHRPLWVVNAIRAELDAGDVEALAQRKDVRALMLDRARRIALPKPGSESDKAALAVEWGVATVGATALWDRGHCGQGVVVAGQDTGYRWDHPALMTRYRGWSASGVTHDHHWHDAIHVAIRIGTNPCGLDSAVPCDDHNHGTHTMGTMLGDDGGSNQIGVAPAARWIGCRNMDRGDGRPGTYLECFQWFLAPTDLAGNNADPALAPHLINNSWSCPPSELCFAAEIDLLRSAVQNLRAAGILVVASAGNSGDACSTIGDAPAPFAASFTVGASNSFDAIAPFSSRGPVTAQAAWGGTDPPPAPAKPDLVAPGVSVRSSLRNGGYGAMNGTSMAGPHVAGVAALLMSADPSLIGDPDRIEAVLRASALPLTSTQNCGDYPGGAVPNAVFGFGRVDALRALDFVAPDFRNGFEASGRRCPIPMP
jgi:serine protease AprX